MGNSSDLNACKWPAYSRRLASIDELEYDGQTAHEYEFHRVLPRRIWVYSPDRYLLPQRTRWLSVDELFEPHPVPELPALPKLTTNAGRRRVEEQISRRNALELATSVKMPVFREIFAHEARRLEGIRTKYLNEEPEALKALVEIANKRHSIAARFREGFHVFVDHNAKVALVEIQFPDFAKHSFQIDATAKGLPKYASEAQKKKIVRQCLYSVVIRAGYLASRVLEATSYKTVAINVSQAWFDPATGSPRTGIICSLQAQVSEFTALRLDQVDPEACFRHLTGIAVPSFDSISPVRPIFVLNKLDDRFIATRELDSLLAPEANLAAMPWEDFEQLVAQLFEWEFAKEGVEVRVTRVSRDRGVDAVLFDPDPLRGGKYVLQAKRYTKPVDVAAVRDLYGTVVNEGANRGILITTSSYGPDSYAFAKDKPISLVDGPNLLVMLRRHGKKFRIDLEEARRLNQERGVDA